MAKNKNPAVPCHRVIKSNFSVGGFHSKRGDSWEKAGLLLKEGAIGVIPTDTIYGVVASALNKKAVEKIYRLKKRNQKKPLIILISSINDLKFFGVTLNSWQKKVLKKFWPGKVSFILKCPSKKFYYLHRGSKTLAFRLPKKKELLKILAIAGPLVAPSANWEGFPPATNISQAKKYFGKNVFYLDDGEIKGKPSALIDIRKNKLEVLRDGVFLTKQKLKEAV